VARHAEQALYQNAWLDLHQNQKSKNKTAPTSDIEIDKSIEEFVANKYEVSLRDLSDLKRFYPEKYENWMRSIGEQVTMMKK
jgi:hypothetical protein